MASGGPKEYSKAIMTSLAELFVERRPLLLRVIARIAGPGEVEDILQETFINSYSAALNNKIDNPQAYMLVTARNLALNFIQRADRRMNCSWEELFDSEIDNLSASVEDYYQSEEKFLVFCRALSRLPPACRRVFIYKKVYGMSQKEIASRLGISASMVEKHIEKGMSITVRLLMNSGQFPEVENGRRSCSTKGARNK